jgi:hypothetical protein
MPCENSFLRDAGEFSRSRELELADLAGCQHGVVSRRQLLGLGVGKDGIAHRISVGRLHRVFAGVYAVGHRSLSREGAWMAAVLASGDGAVLSHRSAAALWGLLKEPPPSHEVTIPRSTGPVSGLRRHHGALLSDETTVCEGIPVTCVARTLFDIAASAAPREFERAIREAEFLRLPQRPSLEELLLRSPRRHGARRVRTTLEGLSRLRGRGSRSPLEDRFLRFARSADLPMPETNVPLRLGAGTYEADCLWRAQRLIVELDGHESHRTRSAFEGDRERDRHLQVAGWRVVRITWRQLNHPSSLKRDLHRLLA